MSGIVESIGSLGVALRSDQRTVGTLSQEPTWGDIRNILKSGRDNNSTRLQMKYPGQRPSKGSILNRFFEAQLTPTSGENISGVVFLGSNKPQRETDITCEWDGVRECWSKPLEVSPSERLLRVLQQGNHLTRYLSPEDTQDLASIWQPFGWTEEGVHTFIEQYGHASNNEMGWFTCVRDRNGRLRAAAKAEALQIGNMNIIESTEWGTHPDSRRMGLGAAAVIGLNANIINTPPKTPFCIFAETNMALHLPGHRVARDAGFSTYADLTRSTPNGLLQQHVSVDGQLRNFLVTQLTPDDVARYYPSDLVSRIVANSDNHV